MGNLYATSFQSTGACSCPAGHHRHIEVHTSDERDTIPFVLAHADVDVSQLMVFGTPDEVRTCCRQAIKDTGGRGYFLGSTTELLWDVRLENAITMFETAWETDKERG